MEGKTKTFALIGILAVLLIVVAYIYWDDVFPPKVVLPPVPTVEETQPPTPNRPHQPGEPDSPPPKKSPPIISG